jgi:hypothetical protein
MSPEPGSRGIMFDRDADVELDPMLLGDEAPIVMREEMRLLTRDNAWLTTVRPVIVRARRDSEPRAPRKRKKCEKEKDGDSVSVTEDERGGKWIETSTMPTIAPLRSSSITSSVTVCYKPFPKHTSNHHDTISISFLLQKTTSKPCPPAPH